MFVNENAIGRLARPNGASLVNFNSGLAGARTVSLLERGKNIVYANDFAGIDPTGAVDCSAAMQAAIDATPSGGTLQLYGQYRCSETLVIDTKAMSIEGVDNRVGNYTGAPPSKSAIYIDTNKAVGIEVRNANVSMTNFVLTGIDATSTGEAVRVYNNDGGFNARLTAENMVFQSFQRGVVATQSYYLKFINCTFTYLEACVVLTNCYNARFVVCTFRARSDKAGTYNVGLLDGSSASFYGCSLESGVLYAAFAIQGSNFNFFDCYFECDPATNPPQAYNIILGANCGVTAIGCQVYMQTSKRWITIEGSGAIGTRVFSCGNRFALPDADNANEAVCYSWNNEDATADWTIFGDSWEDAVGANTHYVNPGVYSGNGPLLGVGAYRVQFPAKHPDYTTKSINTVPFITAKMNSDIDHDNGMIFRCGNNGFAGDDPLGLHTGPYGYREYMALFVNDEWQKMGFSIPQQADSVAVTVEDLVADFNSLLQKLRDAGNMTPA